MVHWPDEAACADWARALAQRLLAQPELADVRIDLHGDLGAGKTTLVRHLLRALGHPGRVKSPTYTVLEPYLLPLPGGATLAVAHLDLYRLADAREVQDAGLGDALGEQGLKLIEWPERAAGAFGPPDLELHIVAAEGEHRHVRLLAHSARGQVLLR